MKLAAAAAAGLNEAVEPELERSGLGPISPNPNGSQIEHVERARERFVMKI